MENVIELSHVDAGYPGVVILKDVTFSIAKSEIFILLGGSGCGKTTIMRHLIGLNPILGGRLTVAGLEWGPKTRDELFRKIGVMYQSGALFGSMTLLENVLLPLEEFTTLKAPERLEVAMARLKDVELEDAADKMPSEISGGMRKRAAIARAMALDPEVILLDEPSAGLDPITSSALDDLILRLRAEKKKTFVVVTHELPSIFKIADRAAMFDKARQGMIALGTPQELKERSADPFVRKFFNRGKSMASDNHASYTRIGLTVVIGVVAIVASLIYIGGMRGEANVVYAETYYDKPVSGLSVGSVVNFRGVKVGEVKEISFVGDKYDVEGVVNSRIYILMALQCGTMNPENETPAEAEAIIRQLIDKAGLRATVTTSGITGLSRIECDYHDRDDSDAMDVPPITWTPKHVYIPAKISLLDNFSVAATKVMNQINRMDLSTAWSNLSSAVESLARATEGAKNMLDARQGDLDLIIDDFSATSASLRDLVSEVKRNPSLLIRERKAQRLEETE